MGEARRPEVVLLARCLLDKHAELLTLGAHVRWVCAVTHSYPGTIMEGMARHGGNHHAATRRVPLDP